MSKVNDDNFESTEEEKEHKRIQMRLKVEGRRTICEIHREIFDIIEDEFKDHPQYKPLVEKLEEAYFIAKKMDAKLMQYKHNYNADWYERTTEERRQEKLALRSKRK